MSIKIGLNISALRKQKGTTQEELAKHVGVSAQAVSKWENGGVPDTELLSKIADYFDVSIDKLFGRENTNLVNIDEAIFNELNKTDEDKRFTRAFELCWIIEQSFTGTLFSDSARFRQEIEEYHPDEQVYSNVLRDSGYTEMGLFSRMQYFLLVPEAKDKNKALFEGINYTELFKTLSDEDFFSALVFFYKRENTNAFTPRILEKELKIPYDKAQKVIHQMHRMYLVYKTVAEVDDEPIELYSFSPRPSFASLLIFAREMIHCPDNFYCNMGGRKKPYLL